jgi:hypothetical protein
MLLHLFYLSVVTTAATSLQKNKAYYMALRDTSIKPHSEMIPLISNTTPLLIPSSSFIINSSYYDMEKYIGGEYTPSGASNELWLAFYSRYRTQVEKDLSNAQRRLATSVLRIFLHTLLWETNANDLLTNLDDLLGIADLYSIKLGLVFFDSCWSNSGASTSIECEEIPGIHNSCWMQSPQEADRTGNVSRYEPYVSNITRHFAMDSRIAWFEIYNEPDMNDPFVVELRQAAYSWAKAQQPLAPVMSCWDYNSEFISDVSDIHRYDLEFQSSWTPAAFANVSKGAIFTEAGCRSFQEPFAGDAGTPLAVLHYLESLRYQRDKGLIPYVPGALLSWEIAVGNSNTRWHWGSSAGTPEPAIPWCGMLFPDSTPVSYTEAAALRRYITGKDEFLYFNNFMGPISTSIVDGKAFLSLLEGVPYWFDIAPGVDVSTDVLVEYTFWPNIVNGHPSGAVELVIRANNITSRKSEIQLPCNSSILLNTNICVAAEGESNFVISPSDPNPVGTCAATCCNQNNTCGAWIVLPGTNFNDKSCMCANSPCTCCWLKPLSCTDTSPLTNCTSGFLNLPPTPPQPIPILSGYVVSANYSNSSLSLFRVSETGNMVLLGDFNISSIENGLVNGWNIIRIAMYINGTINVYMNPTFKDTGFVGNSSDAQRIPHAIMPRISVVDSTLLSPGGLAIASTGSSAKVDYISVLPITVL